jgi:putative chitinase
MNSQFYLGIVESRKDPLKAGRVQVRVFGIHSESKEDIPTEKLPWAVCVMPATSASLSGIGHSPAAYVEGSLVFVFFQDGESKQNPIILGSAHGIPLSKNPFAKDYQASITEFEAATPSKVSSTNTGTLFDSSGQPVTDSAGQQVETGDKKHLCCSSVDSSKMVAKYGDAVTSVCTALCNAGIKDPYAIVGILSNIAKESGFKPIRESMSYSSVSRLRAIFPSSFKNLSDTEAAEYVNNPEKLGNFVYGNKNGNSSSDGYKYRGGGFIQLTFANNYKAVGKAIGVDLYTNPEKINEPEIAAKAVAQYFVQRFGGANRLKFGSLNEALIEITTKVNPGGVSNDLPKVQTASLLCKVEEEQTVVDQKKEESVATKPNDPANDVDPNATKEDIDLGRVNKKTGTNKVGFSDPNGRYPHLLKEQDIHRLARRNTKYTSVSKRMDKRRKGIRTIGGTYDEPQPAYNAKYPLNHVYATESGHNLEFDDTPGAERISMYHTAGTYSEIDKFGNKVNKIVGDSFSITERNGYVFIDGTARITVGSGVKLVVGGNADIEVDGNLNWTVGGSVNWTVGGNVSTTALGNITDKSNATIASHAKNHSVRADDEFVVDAKMIKMQMGLSTKISGIGNSRSPRNMDYPRRIPENFLGADILEIDDSDEEVIEATMEQAVAAGQITRDELEHGAEIAKTPMEEETITPEDKPVIAPSCSIFEKKIEDNQQISKFFTIGMLSSNAAVSHYGIVDNNGLKAAEIACNLKSLAENALDKIKTQYPTMFVTSGFRTGSGSSQHTIGQAADMQFSGKSKGEYFEIAKWIRDNVPFDKLLLEYKTTGTGLPWIHISFKQAGNSKGVFTYMNHKNVGAGLKKLEE